MLRSLVAAALLTLPQQRGSARGADTARRTTPVPAVAAPAATPTYQPGHTARATSAAGLKDPSSYPIAQWVLFGVQVGGLLGLLVYVWKTRQIAQANQAAAVATVATVEEMRRAREEASEPRVVVYFSSASTTFSEIVLENFGDGTAADVVCTFDPPLQTTSGGDAAQFFKSPKWLPPRSRLTHAFDSWIQYIGSDLPRRYTVAVTYNDAGGRKNFQGSFVLDVTAFEHMMQWERKDLHDVATTLEKLSDRVESALSRRRSIEERRDAVWQATPITLDVSRAVSQLLASWRLFKALDAAPSAHAFRGHHFAGMRKSATSAMAGAMRSGASSTQQAAIEAVFVALYNHDFEVMRDQKPAMAALDEAFTALEREWPAHILTSDPGGTHPAHEV